MNINPSLEIDWGLLYNKSMCAHVISDVIKDSPAEKAGLKPGERLVSINGEVIEDIFDYQYLGIGEKLTLSLESEDGSQRIAEIMGGRRKTPPMPPESSETPSMPPRFTTRRL